MKPIDAVTLPDFQSDADLVLRARQGQAHAFRTIMARNNRRLYQLARGILKNDADAEDVAQETYVRAFAHLDRFKGDSSLSTWLARIAINEALGRLRRARTAAAFGEAAQQTSDGATVIAFPNASATPEADAARAEIRRLIERAIDALPDSFRIVFVLRAIEQMSVADVAAALGLPEETVRTRYHRAKSRLQKALSEHLRSALDEAFPFAGARCERIMQRVFARLDSLTPRAGKE